MKTLSKIFMIIFVTKINAQDIIIKNDSSKISSVITEINPKEVKYKLYNYQDGPLIISSKNDIAYIKFKNGTTEKFEKTHSPTDLKDLAYNPNKYNLDRIPVRINTPEQKDKKCEKLYKRKNYIGYNYISFLNSSIGFNYMRDIQKANMIINIPFAFGLGSPAITNSLYSGTFLNGNVGTTYDRMLYQVGINALYAPNMKREVNFLMGPAFNYSSYNIKVETRYTTKNSTQNADGLFTNKFVLNREHYGINIGLLARFSEKVNMNMLVTLGYKKDTYSEKDPFGIDFINQQTKYQTEKQNNIMPYVNFAWSIGYRF